MATGYVARRPVGRLWYSSRVRTVCLVVALTAFTLGTAASAAAPAAPRTGVVVEGASFAGLRLGATPAQVRARWGRRYGICDNCKDATWYYTFVRYKPQGIGVQFHGGRTVAYFTLGAPVGWRTLRGVAVGDATAKIGRTYGAAPVVHCLGYDVQQVVVRKTLVLFYANGAQVYGLGLMAGAANPCR
jgi:hypothetical protein